MTTETAIKTGDTVRHIPSGETWIVAYVRPETNDLAWCGWPEGLARLSDCELVKSCSEEESLSVLVDMANSGRGMRASYAQRELSRRSKDDSTVTTNTPDTTRLSDAELDEIARQLEWDMPMAWNKLPAVLASHRTLAAELARVEGERDRYREALEWYADPNNIDEEFGHGRWQDISGAGVWEDADWFPDGGERARAALNGADNAE